MRSFLTVFVFYLCISFFIGCARVTEVAKGMAGVSTKELERARKFAIAKNFNYDYFTCYTKTLDILKQIRAYIYVQNIKKHMIAIYVSQNDTTPVGVFFQEKGVSSTQIEVSSQSTYARERVANRLFTILEGLPDPERGADEADNEKK